MCHSISLIFKDFAKEFCWMNNTYKTGKPIVKFFTAHNYTLALFKTHSNETLLEVAKTRLNWVALNIVEGIVTI